MPALTVTPTAAAVPLRPPLFVILAAWLLPGSGHFLLGRRGRGAIIFGTVLAAFALGLLMHGSMFVPGGNGFEVNGRDSLVTTAQIASQSDVLSKLIQYGGFLGDLASGAFYILSSVLGYAQPDQAGHSPDYGAKFLVSAGLLNIMAIVDAYEIATRQKD